MEKKNVDYILGQCPAIVTSLKGSRASCRHHMVLIAATATDTDCTYYFAVALQRDAAGENHDLATV
jgi:hypothetical protein